GGNCLSNGFQPIQRRQNNSSSGRAASPPGPPNAPDGQGGNDPGNGQSGVQGIPGVMTPNGFVPIGSTNAAGNNGNNSDPNAQDPRSRQFFGFGGRQQRLGNSGGPSYGRGSNGSYVNLLQLQNNVFAVPSPNGDSLIVTT